MDLDPVTVRNGLITFLILVASFSIHEWAHAIVADKLGDDTPRSEGRVTLNPLVHIDLWWDGHHPPGQHILHRRGAFSFIAWAKPVRVNRSNFRNRVGDDILVSLAGPAAKPSRAPRPAPSACLFVPSQPRLGELVHHIVFMNVGLAVFNMLPFPPLDGSLILRRFIGMSEETLPDLLAIQRDRPAPADQYPGLRSSIIGDLVRLALRSLRAASATGSSPTRSPLSSS